MSAEQKIAKTVELVVLQPQVGGNSKDLLKKSFQILGGDEFVEFF